jgi:hypothetical protein
MFSRSNLFRLFTRTPREGGRKDVPMPEAQAPQAAPAAPGSPERQDEVARQLTTLTEAMRQLAESHKTLLDAVRAQPAPTPAPAPAPAPATANAPQPDIGGDPAGGGQRPGAIVDYSRLSPVQQITLGLKDSATRQTTRSGAD